MWTVNLCWPHCPGRLPLQLFTRDGEGMLNLVPTGTDTCETQQQVQSLQGRVQCFWQGTVRRRGLSMLSGVLSFTISPIGRHQFKSETHHGQPRQPPSASPWGWPCHGLTCPGQAQCSWTASWEVCLGAGHHWAAVLQSFGWKKHCLVVQEYPGTQRAV